MRDGDAYTPHIYKAIFFKEDKGGEDKDNYSYPEESGTGIRYNRNSFINFALPKSFSDRQRGCNNVFQPFAWFGRWKRPGGTETPQEA